MGEAQPSPVFEDIFSKCLLCGACEKVCPRGVKIAREVREARAGFTDFYGEHGYQKFLARKILEQPELLSVVRKFGRTFAALLENRLPASSGLRLQLALFDHHELPEGAVSCLDSQPVSTSSESLIYFPGCSATHLYPETIQATRKLFKTLGYTITIPDGLGCCGVAMDAAGDFETSVKLAKKNILALERGEGKILVTCGSCYAHLRRYTDILADEPAWKDRVEYVCKRLVEMMEYVDQCLVDTNPFRVEQSDPKSLRVFYHDPCHLRNELNITEEPRRILKSVPAIELLELEDGPQCCGQGGLFHLGAPDLSALIRDDLVQKVLAMEPDIITSTCSGCLMQWRTALAAAGRKLPVLHLAELIVQHLSLKSR